MFKKEEQTMFGMHKNKMTLLKAFIVSVSQMIYQCQIRSDLLEGLWIEVTISRLTTDRNGSKANTSYLKIGKIPPVSPIHPAEQNHEGNSQKTAGDISVLEISYLQWIKYLQQKAMQDHAQKSDIGDTGGMEVFYLPLMRKTSGKLKMYLLKKYGKIRI